MDVRLVVKKGSTRARVVRLHSDETIIGRRHDCDLRIMSSQVSRRHCLLSIHDGWLSVEDLDSVNGTFVNGQKIEGKQLLRPGDTFEVGPLHFTVQYNQPRDARKTETRKDHQSDDALDVIPLTPKAKKKNTFAFDDEEELEDLPVVDDDTELAEPERIAKHMGDDDVEEAIPLAEDLEISGDWHPAQGNDLRDILSQMESSDEHRKDKRKGKKK